MGAYPPSTSGVGMQYTIKLGEEWKGCVDKETEILTSDGWKKYNEVGKETKFATYNRNSHILRFEKALSITKTNYTGEMVSLSGRNISQLITPTHRSLYQTRVDSKGGSEWKIKPASELKKRDIIPIATKGVS